MKNPITSPATAITNQITNSTKKTKNMTSTPLPATKDRSELSIKDVQKYIGDSFTQATDVSFVLAAAFKAGQNVWKYGKGGYGKSHIAKHFGKYLLDNNFISTEPFILSMHADSDVDDLYGGVDIKKYTKDGELDYNLIRSMFSKELVILEEAGDASSPVLAALKAALESGVVENGAQQFKSNIKMVIVCTNVDMEQFMDCDSNEAFAQRFNNQIKVEWANHSIADYQEFFAKKGYKDQIANIISNFAYIVNTGGHHPTVPNLKRNTKKEEIVISPRIALKAYNAVAAISDEMTNPFKILNYQMYFKDYTNQLNLFYNSIKKDMEVVERAKKYVKSQLKKVKELDETVSSVQDKIVLIMNIQEDVKIMAGSDKFAASDSVRAEITSLFDDIKIEIATKKEQFNAELEKENGDNEGFDESELDEFQKMFKDI